MGLEALPWWQTGVVYQVYPRSFQDSNGDGVGDLAGVTQRLHHLAELGITAVWLSPFYRSPMADFGYDVADYCDVDPVFGTLADFDELVVRAHVLGLRVVVDFVPNHSSIEHPWFADSRLSREAAKRDWYTWRDGRSPGVPPNNWLSVFGGPAWTHDPTTDQWYLHSFLAEQPDVNWRNPAMRQAMLDAFDFWLNRGVDGFRIDVAHFIAKDPDLTDNPPADDWRAAGLYKDMGAYGSQHHVNDCGHADVHEMFREIRAVLDRHEALDGRDRYSVGEIHETTWDRWVSYYGDGDELHMPFNFALVKADWTAEAVRSTVEACETALLANAHAWPNWVLGNHDEHRIATRVGPAQARVAMMLLLTLRGTPTMYYGDELGMLDVPVPDHLQQDPWGRRVGQGLGRDPERTPMVWDSSVNAGFTEASVTPWLPIGDNAMLAVSEQAGLRGSMLELTRALLALRRSEGAFTVGSTTSVAGTPDGVYAYVRRNGGRQFLVVLNFASDTRQVTFDPGWTALLSTHPARFVGDTVMRLDPDEGVICRRA